MPDRQKRADVARFQNEPERYGWQGREDNDPWDSEDRHYVPGPRGPEADDFERRTVAPSDETEEDNVC